MKQEIQKIQLRLLKYLQKLNKVAKILIFWDGASYHKYAEMRDYLCLVNQDARKI